MPNSEPLDVLLNASLRVSRPVAACSRCRGAKIKCDGKLPACTACERSGKGDACSGANDDFAKGKERSYVAALESACERLQKRINNANGIRGYSNGDNGHDGESGHASDERDTSHRTGTRKMMGGGRQGRREASDVDDLVGDFGYLAVNATSRDFYGFSDAMSFAKLMLFTCQKQPFPQYVNNLLPPRHATVPSFQHYFDNIFTLFPFFSETNFMASVTAVYSDNGRFSRASDHFIVRMVLAISAASKSRRIDDLNARDALRHASAAMGYVEAVINPGSVSGVQAILLLAQYSLLDPLYLSCWNLMGVASRLTVDLGIHQETAADLRLSKDQMQMRRRAFYSVFTLDRLISMSFSRAFSFTDESTMVELPATLAASSTTDAQTMGSLFLRPLEPSYHLFKIRIRQSKFYHTRNSDSRSPLPVQHAQSEAFELARDAYAWFRQARSALPPQQSRSTSLFFRLEMLYTQVLALSTSPRDSYDNHHAHALLANIATDYLLNLAPAVQDPDWYALLSHMDILRVSHVALTLLHVLSSSFDTVLEGAPSMSTHKIQLPPTDVVNPASHDVLANISRVLSSLEAASRIMLWSEQRWGVRIGDDSHSFENESAAMLTKLKTEQCQLLNQKLVSPSSNPIVTVNYPMATAIQSTQSSVSISQHTHRDGDTQSFQALAPSQLNREFRDYQTA